LLFDGRIIAGITVFVAVARTGSFIRAAEQLGLSRSGIGKAIGRLEERTGMRLFDRNGRAIKLTDQGRTFLEETSPMLEALGRIATPSTPENLKGRLRISTDGALGPYLLVPLLPQFLSMHPQVKVDLIVRDHVDNLLSEGIDAAIRFGQPNSNGLDKKLLFRSRVLTCASTNYLNVMGAPTSPRDMLNNHRCIRMSDAATGKPYSWNMVNSAGEEEIISPECGLTLNDAPSLVAAATNDYGIVRLLDLVAEEQLRTGALVEVLPEWNNYYWPAFVYTAADNFKSPTIEALKSFVVGHLTKSAAFAPAQFSQPELES